MLRIGTFLAQIESGVGCDGIPDLAAAISTAREYGIESVDVSSAELGSLLSENPELGFTYDSGNFTLAGYDELEGARLFAGRTVHAHIKDLALAEADYPCIIERDGKLYKGTRPGDSFVKNREAIKALKDGGFTDGCVVIELSNKVDRFRKTLESVEWLRRAVECI